MPRPEPTSDPDTGLGPWVRDLTEGEALEPPEVFRRACRASLADGSIGPEENRRLQALHRALGLSSGQARAVFQQALSSRRKERRRAPPAPPPELESLPADLSPQPATPPVLHAPRIARALVEARPSRWNPLALWRHRRAVATWRLARSGAAWAAWTLPTARAVERTVETSDALGWEGGRRTTVLPRVSAVAFGEWGLLLDGRFVPFLSRRAPRIQVERRGDPALLVSWEGGVPGYRTRVTLRVPVPREALPRARGVLPQMREHLRELGFWRRAHVAMAALLPALVVALRAL